MRTWLCRKEYISLEIVNELILLIDQSVLWKLFVVNSQSSIFVFPDYSYEFMLDMDASNTGLGAVFSQILSDGTERVIVIAYASQVLS